MAAKVRWPCGLQIEDQLRSIPFTIYGPVYYSDQWACPLFKDAYTVYAKQAELENQETSRLVSFGDRDTGEGEGIRDGCSLCVNLTVSETLAKERVSLQVCCSPARVWSATVHSVKLVSSLCAVHISLALHSGGETAAIRVGF